MEKTEPFRIFGEHFEIICGTTEEYLISFNVKYREVSKYIASLFNLWKI